MASLSLKLSQYNRLHILHNESSIILVEGTKIIGFTLVKPTHGEGNGDLWIMGVFPEYTGLQLGSKLLNHAIVALKKQGYKTMSLVVDSANEAALKLYEKYIFIKGWRLKNFPPSIE